MSVDPKNGVQSLLCLSFGSQIPAQQNSPENERAIKSLRRRCKASLALLIIENVKALKKFLSARFASFFEILKPAAREK